jgi:enoyl-CoA hydratase
MNTLLFESERRIGLLTVNRPDSLNALNLEVLNELKSLLESEAEKRSVSALILTGAGKKAFIAGADIKEMHAMEPSEVQSFITLGQTVSDLLENAPFVTIAAVNGYALGGGLEMALACDFIYAGDHAKLGLPEVTLGIIPGFGGTQRLARAVGTRRAKELIATGRHIEAEEAKEIGLVNHVCKSEDLIAACYSTAERIAKHSSLAVSQAKSAINEGIPLSLKEAMQVEKTHFMRCFASPEREQAMQAFIARKANA